MWRRLTSISTLIDTLWRENQDLAQQFLNNDFIKFQSEGLQEDTIPSYQYYTILLNTGQQDYYYLVDYVQYKALRMTTFSETFPTQLLSVLGEETESIQGDIEYAWSTRNDTLATSLSVPLNVVDSGKRAVAQLAYSDWLQKNLDLGWFTLHVMSIPCIYVSLSDLLRMRGGRLTRAMQGWVKLAERWDGNNATRKGMQPNSTPHLHGNITNQSRHGILQDLDRAEPRPDLRERTDGYGKGSTFRVAWRSSTMSDTCKDFLEANKDAYYSANANQTWTSVFRQALQFEIDLFNSALGTSLKDLA
ncbi:hypothetical protein SLS56_006559 [Neofusicoccum ribis]|uniref:Uncharacterized protein n=1 Tax=Neofusicoccum ribis TaxID=45134 RepID=A0ABR3SS14_9PEZI